MSSGCRDQEPGCLALAAMDIPADRVSRDCFGCGAPADLVTLDPNHPSLAGRQGDLVLDGWIFASRSSAIDGVWQAGRQQVRGGKHLRGEAVAQRYRAVLEHILT